MQWQCHGERDLQGAEEFANGMGNMMNYKSFRRFVGRKILPSGLAACLNRLDSRRFESQVATQPDRMADNPYGNALRAFLDSK